MSGKRHRLTTFQAAELLGVSHHSISNWVDSGRLVAERTPGGHRRIGRDDLVRFLNDNDMSIPPGLGNAIRSILVVDDDIAMANWLVEVLIKAYPDSRVEVAHDGFDAGRIVEALRPEVIVLDIYMAGLDGFEVCRRIKANRDTTAATVIALTGHPSAEAEAAIMQAGAAAYLAKPIQMSILTQLIDTALAQD